MAIFKLKHVKREEESGDGGGSGGGAFNVDPQEYEALKATVAKLEENNKTLLQEKLEEKKKAQELERQRAKESGSTEAIEKSWSEKYNNDIGERDNVISQLSNEMGRITAGSVIDGLVNKLSAQGKQEALRPHIAGRIKSEIKDGKPVVRVLDKDGNVSAATIEDLEKELRGVGYLDSLIQGTAASGTGAHKGGAAASEKTISRDEFNVMGQSDRHEFIKSGGKVVDK